MRAPRLAERDLQQAVIDLCRPLGLYAYHTHDSRQCESGFPDLVVIGPGGVLWRELKAEHGRTSPQQQEVLALLTAAGQDAAIWRPSDLRSGAITKQLTALRRRAIPTGGTVRRLEAPGQLAAFDVQPPPPTTPKQKPLKPGEARLVRFKPRRRTLCDDCIRDIHERGITIAPPPLTVQWKRVTKNATDLICEQHKRLGPNGRED